MQAKGAKKARIFKEGRKKGANEKQESGYIIVF